MNAARRIAAFAIGLVVVFVVAVWVGKAIGPEGGAEVREAHHEDTHAAGDTAAAELQGGFRGCSSTSSMLVLCVPQSSPVSIGDEGAS